MHNHLPKRCWLSSSRSFLKWCPNPRGESLTADLLLWGGPAQFALRRGPVCTQIESDLWSYMVILVLIGRGSTLPYSQRVYLVVVTHSHCAGWAAWLPNHGFILFWVSPLPPLFHGQEVSLSIRAGVPATGDLLVQHSTQAQPPKADFPDHVQVAFECPRVETPQHLWGAWKIGRKQDRKIVTHGSNRKIAKTFEGLIFIFL